MWFEIECNKVQLRSISWFLTKIIRSSDIIWNHTTITSIKLLKKGEKKEEKDEFVCFIGIQNETLFKEIHSIFIALAVWGNLFPCCFYFSLN